MADGVSVTDNLNGTASVAIVLTGPSAGASWILSYSVMSGRSGVLSTVVLATGAGSLTFNTAVLPFAYYLWNLSVTSTTPKLAYCCYTPISDVSQSQHEQILQAVAAQIRTALVVSDPNSVQVKLFPIPTWMADPSNKPADFVMPVIYVSPFGSEEEKSIWNDADNVGYPVTVAYVASADEFEVDAYRQSKLTIRRKINAALRTSRLPGTQAYLVKWNPKDIALPEGLLNSFFISMMNFSFQIREPVGLLA